MYKRIFRVVGFAAFAAVLCAGCTDLGVNNKETYTLTAISTTGGTVARNPDKDSYKDGEQVVVVATSETGYTFAGWSGASTSTSETVMITMDGNKTLMASFKQVTYTFTTNVSPVGGGSVSLNPNKAVYNAGDEVTVMAVPAADYTFSGWSGAGASTSTSPTITVTMDGNKTLTANFARTTYKITTTVSPTGGGTISLNPAKTAYNAGEAVRVEATPNANYTFLGWSGSSTSKDAVISVVMDGNRELTANFAQTANAVIITLTSWQTTEDDGLLGGGLDPRIHFVVTAYLNGRQISSNTTGYLLDEQDIAKSWTGEKRSSPVQFANQADSLVIRAVVVEKDLAFDDDISPGYVSYFKPIPAAGRTGSTVLEYGTSGKSRVGYSYELILQ